MVNCGCKIVDTEDVQDRASRLRTLRGMTRVKFSKKYKISLSNFQNWEGPRYGGLTEKAAKRIIKACEDEGINVKIEWLMYGMGLPPTIAVQKNDENLLTGREFFDLSTEVSPVLMVCNKSAKSKYRNVDDTAMLCLSSSGQTVVDKREYSKIAKELNLFKENYEYHTLETVITNDDFAPVLRTGDFVAGVRSENLQKTVEKICIVDSKINGIFIGCVIKIPDKEGGIFVEIKRQHSSKIILSSSNINGIAVICWIRRVA